MTRSRHVILSSRRLTPSRRLGSRREGDVDRLVAGPSLPVGYEEGERFSIYLRSECWTPADLERVAHHADEVWSLDLVGPAFSDRRLATIHAFPRLEILELKQAPIDGAGLSGLVRLPRLRVLRVHLAGPSHIDLSAMPSPPALESLDLTGLPADVLGVVRLGEVAGLKWLTLSADHSFRLDAPMPDLPRLERFR